MSTISQSSEYSFSIKTCLHDNNGHRCTNPGPWCAEHYSERCSGKDFCSSCTHYVSKPISISETLVDTDKDIGYDSNEDLYEPESDHENDPYIESEEEQDNDYPTEEEYMYWVYNDAMSQNGDEPYNYDDDEPDSY